MRQRLKAKFAQAAPQDRIDGDYNQHVFLERYPDGKWGINDHRDGRLALFDDEEQAREHAVATTAMLAARAAAEIFGTKHRVWNVTIEPATAPETANAE